MGLKFMDEMSVLSAFRVFIGSKFLIHKDLKVCFQRTPILNKKHISKGGLNEPPRLENQVDEYCFQFQCLFYATAASQIINFLSKKSYEGN